MGIRSSGGEGGGCCWLRLEGEQIKWQRRITFHTGAIWTLRTKEMDSARNRLKDGWSLRGTCYCTELSFSVQVLHFCLCFVFLESRATWGIVSSHLKALTLSFVAVAGDVRWWYHFPCSESHYWCKWDTRRFYNWGEKEKERKEKEQLTNIYLGSRAFAEAALKNSC